MESAPGQPDAAVTARDTKRKAVIVKSNKKRLEKEAWHREKKEIERERRKARRAEQKPKDQKLLGNGPPADDDDRVSQMLPFAAFGAMFAAVYAALRR